MTLHWLTTYLSYDLRYLSRNSRAMHFNVLERRITSRFTSDNLAQQMQAETLDELQEIWRHNRAAGRLRSASDPETIQRIRMRNLADRIISMERLLSAASESNLHEDYGEFVSTDPGLVKSPVRSRQNTLTEVLLPSTSIHPFSPVRSRQGTFEDLSMAGVNNNLPLTRSRQGTVEDLVLSASHRSASSLRRVVSRDQSHQNSRGHSPPRQIRSFDRPAAETGKGNLALEYSDHGTGDFRSPSFSIITSNASSISPLRYRKHKIFPGKPPLPDFLPGIRCDESNATTLVVTMSDVFCGIEVDLYYTCLHDYDALVR